MLVVNEERSYEDLTWNSFTYYLLVDDMQPPRWGTNLGKRFSGAVRLIRLLQMRSKVLNLFNRRACVKGGLTLIPGIRFRFTPSGRLLSLRNIHCPCGSLVLCMSPCARNYVRESQGVCLATLNKSRTSSVSVLTTSPTRLGRV